jgi:excisionase family DNA binding protein
MTPNEDPPDPEFLTVEEVAGRLKVKEKTVRDWIGRGTLEAYKIGKNGGSAETTSTDTSKSDASARNPPPPADSGTPTAPRKRRRWSGARRLGKARWAQRPARGGAWRG